MRKNKKKLFLLCVCSLTSLYAIHIARKVHKNKTDGFSLSHLMYLPPYQGDFETGPLTLEENRELAQAIGMRYRYLGSGGQCFAFVSEDQRYVIKFFKDHHQRWQNKLVPYLPFIAQKVSKRKEKRKKEFTSYKLADAYLKEEAALIYTHLNPSSHLQTSLTISDKAERTFHLNLDHYPFILQRKGSMITDTIEMFMHEGKEDMARALLVHLAEFFLKRSAKGIYDDDARIHRNFGCIQQRPLLIDIGRLRLDSHHCDHKMIFSDVVKVNHHFLDFLAKKFPPLREFFLSQLQSACEKDASP